MYNREEEKARRIEQLRLNAERWLHGQESTVRQQSLFDLQSLVHELQVHQVELEMQQEELLQSRVDLEKSRNEYSTLYDSSPVAYFTLDHYGQVLKTNHMGSELIGLPQPELLQQHFRNWVAADHRVTFYAFIKKVFGSPAKECCELPLRSGNGSLKFVHLEARVVSFDGEPARCLLAAIDITARREAEEKLRQREAELKLVNEKMEGLVAQRTRHLEQALQILQTQATDLSRVNEQLQHVNSDLDNFIYTASHDLKSPILNIEGLLGVLLKRLPAEFLEADDFLKITQLMQDSVSRFKQTIADLTEVSRLQRVEDQPEESVNITEVIIEVTLDLTPLIEQNSARVVDDTAGCQLIRCSKKNLRSVVYNLLSNAIKYRSPDRSPEVLLKCGVVPGYTFLLVQDNGIGMHPEERIKLFQMFTRMHNHVEGTGIGLYMVKKIIDNLGGKIEVHSQPGEGTTFTLYFPE